MDGQKATYIKGLGTGLVLATALFLFTTLMSKEDKKEAVVKEPVQVEKVEKPNVEKPDKTEDVTDQVKKEDVKEDVNAPKGQNATSDDKESLSKADDNNTNASQNMEENQGGTTPQSANKTVKTNIHSIIIPADYTSRGVSIILAEANVLSKEEIESFNQYITLQKRDLHIQQGTFDIPVGSSYDQIIAIISPKR